MNLGMWFYNCYNMHYNKLYYIRLYMCQNMCFGKFLHMNTCIPLVLFRQP